MILNKKEELDDNQAYYDILKKGVTENYRKYYIELTIYESEKIQCKNIKQIDFYKQYFIIYLLNNHSRLYKYDLIEKFHLIYMGD